jgi:nitrogen regulatory protein PII
MSNVHLKLVTIITEAAIESEICDDLQKLGASGYTVTNARGSGSRGIRNAGWSVSSNIRVEVVCSEALAESIAKHLNDKYYENFAMIQFESDVKVIRSHKFK